MFVKNDRLLSEIMEKILYGYTFTDTLVSVTNKTGLYQFNLFCSYASDVKTRSSPNLLTQCSVC